MEYLPLDEWTLGPGRTHLPREADYGGNNERRAQADGIQSRNREFSAVSLHQRVSLLSHQEHRNPIDR
jgi:hypothetical protein